MAENIEIENHIYEEISPIKKRNTVNILRILAHVSGLILFALYITYVLWFSGLTTDDSVALSFFTGIIIIYIINNLKLFEKLITKHLSKIKLKKNGQQVKIINNVISVSILLYIIYLCVENVDRFFSFGSAVGLMLVILIINFRNIYIIHWSIISRSFNLHFILALTFFRFKYGRQFILYIGRGIVHYLQFSEIGSRFIYGNMLIDQYIFSFYILSSIYLSFLTITILRYLGFFEYLINCAKKLSFILGISPIEGVFGTINIFLSMSETCAVVQNNLEKMTKSEIFSLMVCGLSTISFSALFAFASLGANVDYLIISSIISIPCSFAISQIFEPKGDLKEIEMNEINPLNRTTLNDIAINNEDELHENNLSNDQNKNFLDKCLDSIQDATIIIQIIIGNLIAIMSIIAFLDKFIELLFKPFIRNMGLIKILTCGLSYIIPIIGVDIRDASIVSEMFIKKILINEFVSFEILGKNLKKFNSERSIAIANFLICGFGNISAAGMMSAVIKNLTKSKVNTSSILVKSLCAACIVNIFCACTISVMI